MRWGLKRWGNATTNRTRGARRKVEGNNTMLGDHVWLGNDAMLSHHASLDDDATHGDHASLGDDAALGDDALGRRWSDTTQDRQLSSCPCVWMPLLMTTQ
jgi:hypothetical protein